MEAKLDALLTTISALVTALSDEEEILVGMDGEPLPAERDPNEPL